MSTATPVFRRGASATVRLSLLGSLLWSSVAGADVNTWQFADGVHPTTGGHKLISTEAAKILKSYGWI